MSNIFYSVQCQTDGFGNDTSTWACFKTREEAENYASTFNENESVAVVEQRFGEEYINYWN